MKRILCGRALPAALLFVLTLVFLLLLGSAPPLSKQAPPEPSAAAEPSPPSTAAPAATPAPTPTPVPVPTPTPVPTAKILHPAPPAAVAAPFSTLSGQPLRYEYGDAVPESEPVDESYFADAAFIGNSRTEGFRLYSGIRGADIFAAKSISVFNISYERVVGFGDSAVTILNALGGKQYAKVYIMLGINEIGYSVESYAAKYAELVEKVAAMQPDAVIYIQALMPVTKAKDASSDTFTNARIARFNEALRAIAASHRVHYIDTYSALADEEGFLPSDAANDGIHLLAPYCVRWYEYLGRHTLTPTK